VISWDVRLIPFVILFLVLACASAPPPAGLEPEGALVAADEIPGNFLMRQQIDFRYGEESGSFEAVVQKHCDELTVIGFTPFGTRAFSIRQRGLQVSVESHLAGAWPFSPRFVLLDIHRSYFVPIPENPPHEGTREVSHGGESILERWSAGRLVERSYRPDPAGPAGGIVVRYVDGATARVPARHVRLHNERYGYDLEVITVFREELACP
jgi:hypothetical protein